MVLYYGNRIISITAERDLELFYGIYEVYKWKKKREGEEFSDAPR